MLYTRDLPPFDCVFVDSKRKVIIMLHTSPGGFALVAITLSTMVALPAGAQLTNERAKLLPSDGAAGDLFGVSVAVSGTTAVVGARLDDDNGSQSGSVYLFETTTGQQIAKLLPSDGAPDDWFGWSVAVSGTTAVAAANFDDDNGTDSGSAYLFDTTTDQQIAKLLPNDGAAGDQFGRSVAIRGTTVVIGASFDDDNGTDSGSAYLFDTTTGQQIAKLLPSDGAADDQFGRSVAIRGTTAVVGAWFDGDNGDRSGSAYLFDTSTGQQIAKLLPSDGAADDLFGSSVAISGTTAVIGAYWDDDNGYHSGSVYLFDTTTGQQIAKLLPNDGAAGDEFGRFVAISGTTAVAAATRDDDNGTDSGSVYLFDTTTGQQIAKLLPSDGGLGDAFGVSVTISGTTVVAGAPFDDGNGHPEGTGPGSAYLFTAPSACPADLTGDGVLDFFDVQQFLNWYAAGDLRADFVQDGTLDFFDVQAFLNAYAAGCP